MSSSDKTQVSPIEKSPLIVQISVVVIFLALAVFFVAPTGYIVQKPGPTANVLGSENNKELIAYDGASVGSSASSSADSSTGLSTGLSTDSSSAASDNSSQSNGALLLLTVSVVGGPGSYMNSLVVVPSILSSKEDVIPTEAVYAPKQTLAEAKQETQAQMQESQNTAVLAAKSYLPDLDTNKVHIQIDNIGGPSAGLIFTLGIIQKAGGMDLTKGRTIAGTGTIDKDGNVGKIGGVVEKMHAAYAQGARVMLVPVGDASELRDVPADLQIFPVQTLDDAIKALTS